MAVSKVESSSKYFWNTKDTLGTGATAQVFAGYNKETGEKVAVKVFSGRSYQYDYVNRQREINVIRQLSDHDNIVKLLAVEEQRNNKQVVIVMELCTGGNLYEVIDAAENAYGLNEQEFLRVMIDVANGMQFLHSKNIVHRDIKPGNIMRFQKTDGSHIFKLTDFGASRELHQGEEFLSYYGTEEYLHPEMYERALINPQIRKKFSAKVDLWSIGATFYQAATGRLPFQSYMRRADKLKMFEIISKKPRGMISGWQRTPNGRTEYSNKLPEDTRISLGLKLLIIPILAGLLENNADQMMEFDEFFYRISRIAQMKVIDVFVVCQCWCCKVYIDPESHNNNNSVEVLMNCVNEQTGIPQTHMEIFFDNHPFMSHSALINDLPITTEDRPVFVYGGPTYDSKHLLQPTIPDVEPPPHKSCRLDDDAIYAKTCTQIAFQYKYGAERLERWYRLMHQAASGMRHAVEQKSKDIIACKQSANKSHQAICTQLSDQVQQLRDLSELLRSIDRGMQGAISNHSRLIEEIDMETANRKQLLHSTMEEIRLPFDKVQHCVDEINHGALWDASYNAQAFTRSVETASSHTRFIKDIFSGFMRDRRKTTLNEFDKRIHDISKGKLHHQLHMANAKVNELITKRAEVFDRLQLWLRQMVPVRHDIRQLQAYLEQQQQNYDSSLNNSNDWKVKQSDQMKRIGDLLVRVINSSSGGRTAASQTPPASVTALPPEIDRYLQELTQITSENVAVAETCFKELERFCATT